MIRPQLNQGCRYTLAGVLLIVGSFALSAFLWLPLFLLLALCFGGSAITAIREGRSDALVAHAQWTSVSRPVFFAVLVSEILAIGSTLTLITCVLLTAIVEWWNRRLNP